MSMEKILRLYLPERLSRSVAAGDHNFLGKVVQTMESRGFKTELVANTLAERKQAPRRDGYALFHMKEPTHSAAACFRRAYFYPFWHIENMASRWDYRVARAQYNPADQDPEAARGFVKRLKRRVFADLPAADTEQGFIYMPLQGRLLDHRSFQTCAPIDMIRKTLRAAPRRRVVVTLHPRETYTDAERHALDQLIAENERLFLGTKPTLAYLQSCAFVVTQNSSLAFSGFVFHKPCILFGKIDFHHIAASAYHDGVEQAFQKARTETPDFDRYIFWFLNKMTINAGRPDATDQILAAFRRLGWDI
jgi:hypothetical protein